MTTITPITTININLQYGFWTGAGYSAGGESPSFIAYGAA